MIYNKCLLALAMSACFVAPAFARGGGNGKAGTATSATSVAVASSATASASASAGGTATSTTGGSADVLNPANVQSGSQSNGQAASGAAAGQAPSQTDAANFINFCTGKTLTNGLQVKTGSCNGIVMGDIPATTDMVTSILTNPEPGQNLAADTTFNVTVQMAGIDPGTFTNPDVTYYAAPQQLNNGKIIGHTHVTIQTLGNSLTPTTPPDPTTFVFFKGINDAGNGQGLLAATVTGGLPAGNYRVCTMAAAANHQPVTMPVAQRGAQDDCTKFTVGGAGGATGTTGGAGGSAAPSGVASSSSASTAGKATSTATAGTGANGNKGNKGFQGARKGGKGKYTRRAFAA